VGVGLINSDNWARLPSIVSILDRSSPTSEIVSCPVLVCASCWRRLLSSPRSTILSLLISWFIVDIRHPGIASLLADTCVGDNIVVIVGVMVVVVLAGVVVVVIVAGVVAVVVLAGVVVVIVAGVAAVVVLAGIVKDVVLAGVVVDIVADMVAVVVLPGVVAVVVLAGVEAVVVVVTGVAVVVVSWIVVWVHVANGLKMI